MRDRIFALMIVIAMPLAAQPPQGGRGGPPQSPQTMAPVDLTGYWVSVVNEDWRFRMVMKPPGTSARRMVRRRCCACRNIFTSHGQMSARYAWTPTRECRFVCFISEIGSPPQARRLCREIL